MMSLRPGCMVRTICGQLVTSCLHLGAKIDAHLRKNRLKRPKIKQGTTSKVNCILLNRLLSKVLLNKSGLVRAKAGSFTLKTLNGCFSNYYQVRTWPVFAEKVTYKLCTIVYTKVSESTQYWGEGLKGVSTLYRVMKFMNSHCQRELEIGDLGMPPQENFKF